MFKKVSFKEARKAYENGEKIFFSLRDDAKNVRSIPHAGPMKSRHIDNRIEKICQFWQVNKHSILLWIKEQ